MHENQTINELKAKAAAQYGGQILGARAGNSTGLQTAGMNLGAGCSMQDVGCTEAPRLSFSYALDWLKAGRRVSRRGWNGNGIFLELQTPDANSKMSAPYIFIDTTGLRTDNPAAPRVRVPWVASQTDLLADDWQQA